MYFCPPAHQVCPNNEVVEFQPQAVPSSDLGSETNAYTVYNPHDPPVPPVFWIVFFPLPMALSLKPSPSFICQHRLSLTLHPFIPTPSLSRLLRNREREGGGIKGCKERDKRC